MFFQDRAHLPEDILPHVRSGNVQHVLLPRDGRRSARHVDAPVRMRPEQFRFRRDHLRLVPDAEFQSHFVDGIYESRKIQLLGIDKPVAQRGGIVVSLAKPAVVHDQHLNAQFLGAGGKGDQLVGVKVKIRRFPAVDQQGTFFGFISAADQMRAISAVEGAAHAAQALV